MTGQNSALTFRRDPLACLDEALSRQPDAVWVQKHELCIGDPIAARDVLANSQGHFEDHSDFFHTRRGQFGTRAVQAALRRQTHRLLRTYTDARLGELDGLVKRIVGDESSWPDTGNWLAYHHLADALIDPGRTPGLQRLISEIVSRAVLAGARERSPRWRRVLLRYRVARDLARAIDQRRSCRIDHPADLLDVVIGCADPNHSSDELAELFLSYIFASAGSIGFMLGWAVYLFGTHPRRAVPPDWIVKEALRLWPVAWLLSRRSVDAHTISGISITPEDSVNVCPYMVHRHPRFWPDPNVFRPERWAEPLHQESGAYIPFGHGPHRCVAAFLSVGLISQMFDCLVKDRQLEVLPLDDKPQVGPALAPPRFILKLRSN